MFPIFQEEEKPKQKQTKIFGTEGKELATERRGFVLLFSNRMPSQLACHINVFQNFKRWSEIVLAHIIIVVARRDFIVISISVFCLFFR